MTYDETIKYLYDSAPMFQHVGAPAYKAGMENSFLIDARLRHPHRQYRTVHVGGTNGKGSTCHLLASVLQAAGYRVGLYTSPHLLDFRERIKVDGEWIERDYVVRFMGEHKAFFESVRPSFFEITTGMAFAWFARQAVDAAVIEVGLGGRLDCTNVITPVLSVITNISLDHTALLGNTLKAIAEEKAGIIKPGVPTVIGEAEGEVREVFERARQREQAGKFVFVQDMPAADFKPASPLQGVAQEKNMATVLCALDILGETFVIPRRAVEQGAAAVTENTGLAGRWQVVGEHPKTVLDVGHNAAGIACNVLQLQRETFDRLHIVFGMSGDKDVPAVLRLLPAAATYYFTQANLPRALDAHRLAGLAAAFGLRGAVYLPAAAAFEAAKARAADRDFIFVGGSAFVVGEILAVINQ